MGAKTGIEWTDSTWSPIRFRVKADAAEIARAKGYNSLVQIAERMAGRVGQHCEHVSAGCEHCYAETNNHRCLPANGTGLPYDRRSRDLVEPFIDEKVLLQPLKWGPVVEHLPACDYFLAGRKNIRGCGCPERARRIFPQNQSDLFAEWVPDAMLDRVFAAMALCHGHIFQVLTKRPERMLAYLTKPAASYGVNDRWGIVYDKAMEILHKRHGVDIRAVSWDHPGWPLPNVWLGVSDEGNRHERIDILRETPAAARFVSFEPLLYEPGQANLAGISWAIAGGESGPGARPMETAWARSLRDQCAAAGVAFFFKQWGEWGPTYFQAACNDGAIDGDGAMARVGKKAAGALLDGVEHKEFPPARGID